LKSLLVSDATRGLPVMDPASLTSNINIHSMFIAAYPQDKSIPQLYVTLGDLYYAQGKTDKGVEYHLKVLDTKTLDPPLRRLAFERIDRHVIKPLLDRELKWDFRAADPDVDDRRCDADANLIQEAVDKYLKQNKNFERKAELNLKLSLLLLSCNDISSGINRLQKLVKDNPNSPESQRSVTMVSNFYETKKDYKNLIEWSRELIKNEIITKKNNIYEFVLTNLKNALWNQGQLLFKEKMFEQSMVFF